MWTQKVLLKTKIIHTNRYLVRHDELRSSQRYADTCFLAGITPQHPAGAIRMARLRDRRQRGFRCYSIEVCEADIDVLVAHGFPDRLRRKDPGTIERAIGAVLDRI